LWKKWASRDRLRPAHWAPLPEPPVVHALVPLREMWRYTVDAPAANWNKPDFDAASWPQGRAGFGTDPPDFVRHTEWKTADIWLRREMTVPAGAHGTLMFQCYHDEDVEIYVNGIPAAAESGFTTRYVALDISQEARAALQPGAKILVAVHCHQTEGGQGIDVGLSEIVAAKKAPPAKPLPPPAGLRKLMDLPMRDPSVCRAPDGNYYLTGTSPPFWGFNNQNGIRVWKSPDLKSWQPLGTVWRYGRSPWHAKYLAAKKPLWAPEIHYAKGTFWLTYSMPGWDGGGKTSGSGLLKSTSGKADGPYVDMQPAAPLGDEIDASLFEDDDGSMYFLWHSGKIARLKSDMSGLAEPYHWLKMTASDSNPHHHSGLCAGIHGAKSFDHVGYEGMYLFKANGRYYFTCSEIYDGRYSCMAATSKTIYGPYSPRYEAIPHGGHNTFFQDAKGAWWSTYFGPPWSERPSILPVSFDAAGRLRPGA
jgi:xylan 1,4-beta-xylosidase